MRRRNRSSKVATSPIERRPRRRSHTIVQAASVVPMAAPMNPSSMAKPMAATAFTTMATSA
jgi:hypothetical protein